MNDFGSTAFLSFCTYQVNWYMFIFPLSYSLDPCTSICESRFRDEYKHQKLFLALSTLALISSFPSLHFKDHEPFKGKLFLKTITSCCPPQDLSVVIIKTLYGGTWHTKVPVDSPAEEYYDWAAWLDAIGDRMYGYEKGRRRYLTDNGLLTSSESKVSTDMFLVPLTK